MFTDFLGLLFFFIIEGLVIKERKFGNIYLWLLKRSLDDTKEQSRDRQSLVTVP